MHNTWFGGWRLPCLIIATFSSPRLLMLAKNALPTPLSYCPYQVSLPILGCCLVVGLAPPQLLCRHVAMQVHNRLLWASVCPVQD